MKPYLFIADQALEDPWALRDHAVTREYGGEVGPDGVLYPNISTDVPAGVLGEVATLLSFAVGGPVDVKLAFLRLSLADTLAPHWAHTDAIISDYLALLYLTLPGARGGTAIVEHRNGMRKHPRTATEIETWRRDTNRPEQWAVVALAPMRFNRLVVLPTDVFHAATPQGFGTSARDGRLVLITFFSPKE
jgi:hypothetical protein